jgi:uncharacterized membrane protein
MTVFLLGLLIFLGVHSISIVNEPWRDRMVKVIGKWPWKGLYSLVAAFGFVLIIWGYGLSSSDSFDLYVPPLWLHRLALLVLLPVFVLFLAAYFPGRIKKATGHPMLLATCLWAAGHLLANGSLVNVILFGSFLAWALADRISVENRQPRQIPEAPSSKLNDLIVLVLGLGLYSIFLFWLHYSLIGVSPF